MRPSRKGTDLIHPPPQDRMGEGNEGSLDTRPGEPLSMPEGEARGPDVQARVPSGFLPTKGRQIPLAFDPRGHVSGRMGEGWKNTV